MGRVVTNFHVLKHWLLMPIVNHGYSVVNCLHPHFSTEDRGELRGILEEFEEVRGQRAKSAEVQISGSHVDIRGYHTVLEDDFSDKKLAVTLLERLHLVLRKNPVNPQIYVKIQEVFNELGSRPSRDLAAAIGYGVERHGKYERAQTTSRSLGIPSNDTHPSMHWNEIRKEIAHP